MYVCMKVSEGNVQLFFNLVKYNKNSFLSFTIWRRPRTTDTIELRFNS